MGINYDFSASKILCAVIIAVNILLLIFGVKYFMWFNLSSADAVLQRYIDSIKLGEGQLAIRVIDKFDWVDYRANDNYEKVLLIIDRIHARKHIGKIIITNKVLAKDRIKYLLDMAVDGKIKKGRIILIKRDSNWRILHDNLFTSI